MNDTNTSNDIRVRFAPSPTGYLHIGGARTALFNYLFAKKMGGKFILRIDDTDFTRNTDDSLKMVLSDLLYLGLNWDCGPDPLDTSKNIGDDGPYKASDRLDIYLNYAKQLVDMNRAYYHDGCIKFKIDVDKKFKFYDIVRGLIDFSSAPIDDFVIIRSNNIPTYNFACVVDDYLMKISHVLRGDDHINNTLPQLMIYDAFNWQVPKFGHLSSILGPDKKKLSKRDGATSITDFKIAGYTKDALLNFMSLLGSSDVKGRDIFSLDDTIKNFSLKRLVASPAVFDKDKLHWMNGMYIRSMNDLDLKNNLLSFDSSLKRFSDITLIKAVDLFKPALFTYTDSKKLFNYIDDSFDVNLDGDSLNYINAVPDKDLIIRSWINYVKSTDLVILDDFVNQMKGLNVSSKDCFWIVRALMIGSIHGPDIRKMAAIINKGTILNRIDSCLLQMK